MTLRLAYNTSGFPQHEIGTVAELLAELGCAGIAITPDTFHLNPLTDGLARARELAPRLADLGLAVAVESGARFLLDARRKHQPTLLSGPAGARARLDLLRRGHEIAVALRAETFSFWSGAWAPDPEGPSEHATAPGLPGSPGEPGPAGDAPEASAVVGPPRDALIDRLCEGTEALLDACAGSGVTICLEPEPGMLVASLAELQALLVRLQRDELRVMLDVGHVPVTERLTPAAAVSGLASRLGGLQLDDCRGGVHEHLCPGDGEIDWPALIAAVARSHFTGLASLELPRHAHDPLVTARRALQFLRRIEAESPPSNG